MNKKIVFAAAFFLIAFLVLSGCTQKKDDNKISVKNISIENEIITIAGLQGKEKLTIEGMDAKTVLVNYSCINEKKGREIKFFSYTNNDKLNEIEKFILSHPSSEGFCTDTGGITISMEYYDGNKIDRSYHCPDRNSVQAIENYLKEFSGGTNCFQKSECATDADCVTDGCSGQICRSKNSEPVFTTCEWKPEFDCLKLSACSCIEGKCEWEKNSSYIECLNKLE